MARKAKADNQPGVGVTTPVTPTAEVLTAPNFDAPTEAITPRSITAERLAEYKWYRDLPDEDKDKVKEEGRGLATSLLNEGRSKLAVGQHLYNLNAILTPHNAWIKFLKQYNFNVRKANRRISAYKNAAKFLPETVIQVAAMKNVDILSDSEEKPLGRFTAAVKALPPPEDPTPDQADKYLTEVIAKEKQIRQSGAPAEAETEEAEAVDITPLDPQLALKECYKFVILRLKKLPKGKTVENVMKSLFGMLQSEMKVTVKTVINPMAVPEEFKIGRGRPRAQAVQ